MEDKNNPRELHLHPEECNQCGRCLKVAPPGSLKIDKVNFHAFQEALAISTSLSLGTFAPGKAVHIIIANQMTPGLRLLRVHQHAHPAGRGDLRVGRYRGSGAGRAGRHRPVCA